MCLVRLWEAKDSWMILIYYYFFSSSPSFVIVFFFFFLSFKKRKLLWTTVRERGRLSLSLSVPVFLPGNLDNADCLLKDQVLSLVPYNTSRGLNSNNSQTVSWLTMTRKCLDAAPFPSGSFVSDWYISLDCKRRFYIFLTVWVSVCLSLSCSCQSTSMLGCVI